MAVKVMVVVVVAVGVVVVLLRFGDLRWRSFAARKRSGGGRWSWRVDESKLRSVPCAFVGFAGTCGAAPERGGGGGPDHRGTTATAAVAAIRPQLCGRSRGSGDTGAGSQHRGVPAGHRCRGGSRRHPAGRCSESASACDGARGVCAALLCCALLSAESGLRGRAGGEQAHGGRQEPLGQAQRGPEGRAEERKREPPQLKRREERAERERSVPPPSGEVGAAALREEGGHGRRRGRPAREARGRNRRAERCPRRASPPFL